jgi:DNA-binding MarR family transcriptional regulator
MSFMSTERPLAEDLAFLLSRASGVVARSASKALAPLGLRVRSYSVLAFVCDEEAGLTQRQLASLIGLDPSQLVSLVDDLESRGLVRRTMDATDRRNKLVATTDEGLRLRAEAARRIAEADAFAGVSAKKQDELRAALKKLAFSDNDS